MSKDYSPWKTEDDFLFETDYNILLEAEHEHIGDYGFCLCRADVEETHLPTEISLYVPIFSDRPEPPMVLVQGKRNTLYNIDMIPVTISKTPKILNPKELLVNKTDLTEEEWFKIIGFISKNCDVLMAHWNGEVEECEFIKEENNENV